MNGPKAQFQVNHGSGWETVVEVDIINGVVKPPNEWTMVRALQKRIHYTGYAPEKITVAPSNPRDTHFAGYAKAVLAELLDEEFVELLVSDTRKREAQTLEELNEIVSDSREWKRQAETILARCAYDLAVHMLNNMPSSAAAYEAPQVLKWIPDLTELPKEEREQ